MAAAERTAIKPEVEAFVALELDRREVRRVREAVRTAQKLLGRPTGQGEAGPQAVAELITDLEAAMAPDQTDADEREQSDHAQQLNRLQERFRRRRQAFGLVEAGVARLREMTSPAAILEGAPRWLCQSSEFERVLLSAVDDARMTAAAVHFETDPQAAASVLERLVQEPIALEHPLLEAEVLRRRRATAVADARLNQRVSRTLTETMEWSSYVVAPVVIQGRVIAVLHADRLDGALDVLHREVLWRFAVGLAQAYESASLRRGLRREREYMRRFLDRLDARLAELSDSAIELAPRESSFIPEVNPRAGGAEQTQAFEGILTRREVEVMALLAEGLSNRAIADRLVISEGTVKFHVNSILRKLRAANRAEAVSRYLTRVL